MKTSKRCSTFTTVKKSTDQLGRTIEIPDAPLRIVSVVPSQTELLYDLGLDEEVVGITRFCIHPRQWFLNKERVGGTKKIDLDRLRALSPNLIIANKEENTKEELELLMKEFPVWVSDVRDLGSALDMIRGIGELTDSTAAADGLCQKIEMEFKTLQSFPQRSAAYLIWKDPWMTVNKDTFIHDMLEKIGYRNCFASSADRYPQISMEELRKACPDVVFLSSEPYPFKEKHLDQIRRELPNAKVRLVDGELFSWYGSRLVQSPAYFRSLRKN